MKPLARHFWTLKLFRWLLPAALLVLGYGARVEAVASLIASSAAFDAVEHAHDCECATKCKGASCCCGHRKSSVQPPKDLPIADSPQAAANPCLKSAPCGDPGLPSAPSAGRFSTVDALACDRPLIPDAVGRLLPSSARCSLPPGRACRLDDPPERSAFA